MINKLKKILSFLFILCSCSLYFINNQQLILYAMKLVVQTNKS